MNHSSPHSNAPSKQPPPTNPLTNKEDTTQSSPPQKTSTRKKRASSSTSKTSNSSSKRTQASPAKKARSQASQSPKSKPRASTKKSKTAQTKPTQPLAALEKQAAPEKPVAREKKILNSHSVKSELNWETLRKNLYSPQLYWTSWQSLQTLNITATQHTWNAYQKNLLKPTDWITPFTAFFALSSHAPSQASNDDPQSSSKAHASPSSKASPSLPIWAFGLTALKMMESQRQLFLKEYSDYCTQLNEWQKTTWDHFSHSESCWKNTQTNTTHEQWPHSHNYLWFGRDIKMH